MKFTTLHIFILAAGIILVGCGGGGDSGTTNNVSTAGNQNATTPAVANGIFIDSIVNGLEYTGSPSGRSGITGAAGVDGEFTVATGDAVTFKLGNLVIGVSPPVVNGSIITPTALSASLFPPISPQAARIAQLLQSLDIDKNPSNGIMIAGPVRDRLRDGSVDAATLQLALQSGQNYDLTLGGMIHILTNGNANRAQHAIVSVLDAQRELSSGLLLASKLNYIWRLTGAPVAIATVSFSSTPFNVLPGTPVLPLDATRSFDPDKLPLTYLWTIISQPPGSNPVLSSTTSAITNFTHPDQGDYTIELKVTDQSGLSAVDTISVSNASSGGIFSR